MIILITLLLVKVLLAAGDFCDFESPCKEWKFDGSWEIDSAKIHKIIPPKNGNANNNHFAVASFVEKTTMTSNTKWTGGTYCLFFNIFVNGAKNDISLGIYSKRWLTTTVKIYPYLNNTWTSIYVDYNLPALTELIIELRAASKFGLVVIDDLTLLDTTCKKGFKSNKIKILPPVLTTTIQPTTPTKTTEETATIQPTMPTTETTVEDTTIPPTMPTTETTVEETTIPSTMSITTDEITTERLSTLYSTNPSKSSTPQQTFAAKTTHPLPSQPETTTQEEFTTKRLRRGGRLELHVDLKWQIDK